MLQVGVWLMRIFIVGVFFLVGGLSYRVMKTLNVLSQQQTTVFTIAILLLPINGSRIGLTTFRASLSLLALLLAMFLLLKRRPTTDVVAILLLFTSSFWPSLQVFGLTLPLVSMIQDLKLFGRVTGRSRMLTAIVVLMAVVHRYVVPDVVVELGLSGKPIGYNSIGSSSLVRGLLVLGVLGTPLAWSVISTLMGGGRPKNFQPMPTSVGLWLLALGTFPYLVVGHFPNLSDWITVFLPDTSDWNSRHQLLQGPGLALLIVGVTDSVRPELRMRALALVVLTCLSLSIGTNVSYYADSLKQRDFIAALQENKDRLVGVNVLEIKDRADDLNARGRVLRHYEWSGLATQALGRPITATDHVEVDSYAGCIGKSAGRVVTIEKVSGRLKAIVFRTRLVSISIDELIVCN